MAPIQVRKALLAINKVILIFLLSFGNVSFAQKIKTTSSINSQDVERLIFLNNPVGGASIVIGSLWVGKSGFIDSVSIVKTSLNNTDAEELKSKIIKNHQKLDKFFRNKEIRFFCSKSFENQYEFNSKTFFDYARWRVLPSDFYKSESKLKRRKVIYLKEIISVMIL